MPESDRTKKALEILWSARDNLLKFLADDLIEKEAVLNSQTGYDGAFSFEFQEIDNRFMGRLSSLNTFIHNLQPAPAVPQQRRPAVANRVEVVRSSLESLEADLNAALKRNAQLRLVSTSLRETGDGNVMAVMCFTSP